MMHFPLCFRFPPIFEKNSDSVENLQKFTFSRSISSFSSTKISDDLFFSHRPQIYNVPPIFPVSVHFPPVLRKLLFPPTLKFLSPVLEKLTSFLYTLCVGEPRASWLVGQVGVCAIKLQCVAGKQSKRKFMNEQVYTVLSFNSDLLVRRFVFRLSRIESFPIPC